MTRTAARPLYTDLFYGFWFSDAERTDMDRVVAAAERRINLTRTLIRKYEHVKTGLSAALFSRGLDASGRLRPGPDDRPALYRDSVLGPVPKGWRVGVLENRADFSGASAVSANGFPVRPGDVRLSKKPSRPCRAALAETPGVGDAEAYVLRPGADLHAYFLYSLVTGPAFSGCMTDACAARRAGAFTLAQVKRFRAAFPPLEEQERISRVLAGMDKLIACERAHLNKLIRLKQGIIDDLRTGDLRAVARIARDETPACTAETA